MSTALPVFRGLAAVAAFLLASGTALPARASDYTDAQAKALDAAADHEVKDHDSEGEGIFRGLAQQARSGREVTLADLPAPMRDEVRNGRRDTQEAEDRVRLRHVEDRIAALPAHVRELGGNAALLAHATVDTFVARRELSEPRPFHTCAWKALDCAEADLAKLVLDGDRDGDGIPDSRDACPDDPEDRDSFQDEDGCPDPDNDKDGILDGSDRCPNDPEDRDGWQDEDGCPDRDNDGDGIPDVDDDCPNVPENVNGVADEDGCPDDLKPIHFDSDSSMLDADAIDTLVVAADVLKSAPNMRVRVVGHCDSQNSDEYNYRLGHRRAESVKKYLVDYLGIASERISTESAGEDRPVADDSTREGRRMNRRVEFVPFS